MRVVVLMSTYNGERFIEEQVVSILSQLPSEGLLMVRDDGSQDSTVKQIEAFGDSRISVLRGTNIGFARSFLTLLMSTPVDVEMVMFSDQDDVWLPEKIKRAWQILQPLSSQPGLYCSAQMLADETLRPLHATLPWQCEPSFDNALVENIVTGCTAALNKPALALLQSAGVPNGVHFHDWWLYLVVGAFGTVVFDPQPTLMYRQHGSNQIGHGAGWWGRQKQILRFLFKHDWVGILLAQVAAFKRHYGDRLSPRHDALLKTYFYFSNIQATPRLRLMFGRRRWRQNGTQEILFRTLLVIYRMHLWPTPWRRLSVTDTVRAEAP
jgi:glycosyltransferase involved in cell wall biosynthesis